MSMNEFEDTLGTSTASESIVLQFVFIAFYNLLLHPLRNRFIRASHSTSSSPPSSSSTSTSPCPTCTRPYATSCPNTLTNRRDQHPTQVEPPQQEDEPTSKPMSPTRRNCLWMIYAFFARVLDGCTVSVFTLANTTMYISAADSNFSAFAVYFLSMLLPFSLLEIAWDVVGLSDPSASSIPSRRRSSVFLSGLLMVGTTILLLFFSAIPRLKVSDEITALINTTKPNIVKSFVLDIRQWQIVLRAVLLVAPKRFCRDLRSAILVAPVMTIYILLNYLWPPEITGEVGSFEFAYTTLRRYAMKDWSGALLVHSSVVFSAIAWTLNPLWKIDFGSNGPRRADSND